VIRTAIAMEHGAPSPVLATAQERIALSTLKKFREDAPAFMDAGSRPWRGVTE